MTNYHFNYPLVGYIANIAVYKTSGGYILFDNLSQKYKHIR